MFHQLANDFKLPAFDLSVLDNLPVASKIQGYPASASYDCLHWLQYSVYEGGGISWTRNTRKFLPEQVEYAAEYLQARFPKLPVRKDCIHFLRTYGKIREHRDESGRCTAINIGIHNSNKALTRFGLDDDEATFHSRFIDYQCQDGGVYILNTSKLHSVISLDSSVRFLLTMTVFEDYDSVLPAVLSP